MSVEARVRRSDGSIHTVGRIALQYRAWEIAQPRAVMLVLHGLGEHSGRYEQLGTTMAGYGFSSFALDLRGHGASEGRRGYARNFGVLLQDVDRFRREIEGSAAPGVPFFLLGHSMGGLIALRYLQEYQGMFLGGIISAPWLANALNIPRWKITMAAALARVFPALPLSNGLDPDDLSHDTAIVAARRADPLVHDRITPRLFLEVSANMGLALQRADRLAAPLLFLIPGSDRIVDAKRTLQFAGHLPAQLTTLKLYPEMFHEVFQEVDRQQVMRDVGDWVSGRLA